MADHIRFLVLGNGELAMSLANGFIEGGLKCGGAVSLEAKLLPDASIGLSSWAIEKRTQYFEISDANSADLKQIQKVIQADLLLVEWPKILKKATIDLFPLGAIGTHPSCVPFGRGRHPLHWQIVMGYREVFLSIFKLTEAVDAGPLLIQKAISTDDEETIITLVKKVSKETYACGFALAEQLTTLGHFNEVSPLNVCGTHWRKRTVPDIEIDFRMSRNSISRLVRSVLPPFIGAKLVTEFGQLTIIGSSNCEFENWEFYALGSILEIGENSLVLRVDDGPIRLSASKNLSDPFRNLRFVMPPSFYRMQSQAENG